jgi:hypothetical protein
LKKISRSNPIRFWSEDSRLFSVGLIDLVIFLIVIADLQSGK